MPIKMKPVASRSGQLIYSDETENHIVRREKEAMQSFVYRRNTGSMHGLKIDEDHDKEALYKRNDLVEVNSW